MLHIYVDGDACPVKSEVYKVAERYGLPVTLVANSYMRVPSAAWLKLVVVEQGPDEADDWIVEHAEKDDIVVTGDIPLAARCLDKEARVLGHTGRPFARERGRLAGHAPAAQAASRAGYHDGRSPAVLAEGPLIVPAAARPDDPGHPPQQLTPPGPG